MKLYKNVLTSIITLVLLSCSATPIPTPDIGIEAQSEKYLEVIAPNGWNSFKTNKPIVLEIRNISKNQIASGPDFGARIFVRTDKEWLEVKNKELYQNGQFTLDPTENYDPLKTASTIVRPDLSDYSVTTHMRIFVVGTLIEHGKESKKVASYIDLELNP